MCSCCMWSYDQVDKQENVTSNHEFIIDLFVIIVHFAQDNLSI